MKHTFNPSPFAFGAHGLPEGACYAIASFWQTRKGTWCAWVRLLNGCAVREGLLTSCDARDWIHDAADFAVEHVRLAEAAGEPADDARSSGQWARALAATQKGA